MRGRRQLPPGEPKVLITALSVLESFNWEATPLGTRGSWPSAIITTVDLVLACPVPIVTLWGQDGIMIYNDAYAAVAGGRHPALFGAPVRLGWPEVADFNDNVMKAGLAGQALSYRDHELTLFRNGVAERVWMNLDYSPIYNEQRNSIGVMAIVVETTERVTAARALEQNEARLRFLDALGIETSQTTVADKILEITTRMTGEYLGVSSCAYADMDHDEDGFTIRGDWAAPDARHIVGHYRLADFGVLAVERLSARLPLVINDNLTEIAPHEAATFQSIGIGATICMPLVKNGKLTALMAVHHKGPHKWTSDELAIIREVTERSWAHIERVRSEAAVLEGERRFREELERQVEERTEAVKRAEEALQHSRKLEAIGNLTGGVAHDFNNLLTPIMGNLQLLRRRLDPDPHLLKLVDHALEGARRGASLTSRMLAFARKQEMKLEHTKVGSLLEGMCELLYRSLGAAQIRLKIEPRLPDVNVDPNQFETALLNLVLNARDAMDGEGEIVIAAQKTTVTDPTSRLNAGVFVSVSVTDTGCGMDKKTIERATEPFFTTKGVGKGTGLGLPMVQGFAEQSGGSLFLKSAPGQGTRAELLLPAIPADSAPSADNDGLGAAGVERSCARKTVLVVDDDPLVLASSVAMLEELGQNVVQASSGKEALALLASHQFDVVITDHAMPHMTGFELIQTIRRNYPDLLSIILATGFADLPTSHDLNYQRLSKPYTLHDLATALDVRSGR